MYQVNIGNNVLYYPSSDIACIYDTKLTEDVGMAGEFSFKVPPQNPYYSQLTKGAIITIYQNGDEFWRGEIKNIRTNFAKIAEVYCLEDLSWLGDEFITPARITNETFAQRFQAAIDAYNLNRSSDRQFAVGYITNVLSSADCNWATEYDWSILDSLRECICKASSDSGLIRVRRVTSGGTVTRYIDIVKLSDYGVQATQPIEYGYNLLDYVKDSDYENLVNVLTPYGDEFDSEVYDGYNQRLEGTTISEATSIATYGRHAKAVIFDGVDNLSDLNALAAAYLTRYSQPQLTMEVEAVDLAGIESVDEISIGDSVRIIAKPFAVDQWLYLTEISRDIQNIDKNSITLSGHALSGKTLTSQTINTSAAVKNLPSKSSILDAAFKNVLALINGIDGGYVTFETNSDDQITEIRIANNLDFDQATKCWRWNLGGLAYMHRDNNTDPWQVSVAMTMEGEIVANFITTGILKGITIQGNTIQGNTISGGTISGSAISGGTITGSQLIGATGTITDGTGTVSISGGDLNITNGNSGGAGVFARKSDGSYYSCWGAVNSAARAGGSYLQVPTYDVIVAGNNASDKRLKTKIDDLSAEIAKKLILEIEPKEFRFKNNPEELQFGVIAQDVQKKEKECGIEKNRLCYEREMDGMLAVDYKQLIAPIIKVIQEQQKEINELKGERNG